VINCNKCGRENEDEYKFCLGCGSALAKPVAKEPEAQPEVPQMINCAHCGTLVPSNFKFCGACGGAIAQLPAEAPAAEAPALDHGAPPERATEPASPAEATRGELAGRLIVIRPDGTEGAEIALHTGTHIIGRDSDRRALSNDPFLSPEHAAFSPAEGGFTVRDQDSLNGVFVRIEGKVDLAHGDLVRMGQELLRFELMSEVEPVIEQTEPKVKLDGSPAGQYWGRLCLIAGPDLVSRAFPIGDDGVIIGREVGDILFSDDGFVSGRHAGIRLENGKPVLEDLGSSNGTFRRIRSETHVADGDLLLMGQQLFRLVVV